MATEDVRVTQPVEIKSESEARVAYDLMVHISAWEKGKDSDKNTREYWLTLYRHCRKAARGDVLSAVLEAK
jgi:hypothetical protein